MDNLTHALTGLMLSRAGLNRIVPHASALLMIAANIPDIDVVSLLVSPAAYLRYHRGLTHALVAIPFMAVLPVLFVRLVTRTRMNWKRSWLICVAGVASHPLLDYTNIYGVRWFLPFASEWRSLDITNVVDVWIWGVLLLALAGPAFSRLVSGEIGSAATSGRGWAIFALSALTFYDGGRWFLHSRALAVQEGRMYSGSAPLQVSARPEAVNPFRWRGLVETEDAFVTTDIRLLSEFDPTSGRTFHKPVLKREAAAAGRTEVFRDLVAFSPFTLWQFTPADEHPGATRVDLLDLRFGEPAKPGFGAVAIVNDANEVLKSWFHF